MEVYAINITVPTLGPDQWGRVALNRHPAIVETADIMGVLRGAAFGEWAKGLVPERLRESAVIEVIKRGGDKRSFPLEEAGV